MEKLIVRITKIYPMRVASSHCLGTTPEIGAWEALTDWAKPKGYFLQPGKYTTFGFNNPPPKNFESPQGEEYGYELMINIEENDQPSGNLKVKTIPGGLYAVARVKGVWNIFQTWVNLFKWVESSSEYELNEENEPGLEECLTPFVPYDEMLFDLFLPVKERKL